jgi:hypothetical protein
MKRHELLELREGLADSLECVGEVMRGSLLLRTIRHTSGCSKCARGEGHQVWVLSVTYPGGKNRQVSLHPEQVPYVRAALDRYRKTKDALEAISELNQELLRLDRDDLQGGES